MIGAVLRELNKPLTINKLDRNNLTYGQVLVSVKSSGICGRQIQEINGSKGPDKFLPHLMRHEGGGVVLKWCKQSKNWRPCCDALESL